MKIALIDPSAYGAAGEVVRHRNMRGSPPALALRVVAAVTPPEHEVEIFEEVLQGVRLPERADLVGIHLTTVNVRRGYDLADQYRQRGVKVVLGGVHASLNADEAAEHSDAVVVGEAESVWPQLLDDAGKGALRPCYQGRERVDLSTVPMPRYDLIPQRRYVAPLIGVQLAYETARGCPHGCEFCVVPTVHGRLYRAKPVAQVVDELSRIKQLFRGVRPLSFFFVDDNLCIDKKRSRELFEALIPLELDFTAMLTTEVARDEELVKLAARAGLRLAFLGLESISPESLESVSKRFVKPQGFGEVAQVFMRNGIVVQAAIIFGLEGDDAAIFPRTIDLLLSQQVGVAHFEPLVPLPGTALYRRFQSEGRLLQPKFWLDSSYDLFRLFRHDRLDAKTYERLYWEAGRRFYSLPNIARRLAASANRAQLRWLLPYNLFYRSVHRARSQVRV